MADAFEAFAQADPAALKRAAGIWKQRSAGNADAPEGTKRTAGIFGAVETRYGLVAGAGGGAYGRTEAGHVDLGLVDAYQVLLSAGLVVGTELKLTAEVKKQLSEDVYVKAKASFGLFAGAYARAEGQASVTRGEQWWERGASISGSAAAVAGAKAGAEMSMALGGKGLELDLGAEGEVFAGAEASAEGEATLDLATRTIAIGGEVSAFAGVRASGAVRGKAMLYGREALSGKLGGSALAGAGGSAKVGFTLKGGVLKLDLGAETALGIGAGIDSEVGVDFKPIAVLIWRQTSKALTSMGAIDPQKADDIRNPFGKLRLWIHEYHTKKINYLRAGRASEYVKIEKLQAYIDWVCGRQALKKARDTSCDAAIKQAVEHECYTSDGVSVQVEVRYGKLEKLEVFPDDAVDRIKRGGGAGGTNTPVIHGHNKDLSTIGS